MQAPEANVAGLEGKGGGGLDGKPPQEKICKSFLQGTCGDGANWHFFHSRYKQEGKGKDAGKNVGKDLQKNGAGKIVVGRKPPTGGGPTESPPIPPAAALIAANTLGTAPSAWCFDGVQSHQQSGPSSLLVGPPTFLLNGEEGDDMYEEMDRGPLIDLNGMD